MDCHAFEEMAAAAADGRLPPELREAAEEHLRECPRCRAEQAAQRAVRKLVRERIRVEPAPVARREEILAATETRRRSMRAPGRGRAVLAGALAATLLLGIVSFFSAREAPLLVVARQDIIAAEAGDLSMAMRTDDAATLRGYYQHAGITFPHAADDLTAEGLHLLGGEVASLDGALTTRTVYQGEQGKVVCRRFRAGTVDLPRGGERVGSSRVFTSGEVQVVITPIGDVVCSMASLRPKGQKLARASGFPRAD